MLRKRKQWGRKRYVEISDHFFEGFFQGLLADKSRLGPHVHHCVRGDLFGKSVKQRSGSGGPILKGNSSEEEVIVPCEGAVSGGSRSVRNMARERGENSF